MKITLVYTNEKNDIYYCSIQIAENPITIGNSLKVQDSPSDFILHDTVILKKYNYILKGHGYLAALRANKSIYKV